MRLIDADALKEYIDMQSGRPFIGCTVGDAMKIIIDEQPTVEEWKTGAWKDCGTYADLLAGRVHQCSICGAKFFMANEKYTYCPNCGSEMEGIHESE